MHKPRNKRSAAPLWIESLARVAVALMTIRLLIRVAMNS